MGGNIREVLLLGGHVREVLLLGGHIREVLLLGGHIREVLLLGGHITNIIREAIRYAYYAYWDVEEIPDKRTVWNNGRQLLRTHKCIDFDISRPLLRTKKNIGFWHLAKVSTTQDTQIH